MLWGWSFQTSFLHNAPLHLPPRKRSNTVLSGDTQGLSGSNRPIPVIRECRRNFPKPDARLLCRRNSRDAVMVEQSPQFPLSQRPLCHSIYYSNGSIGIIVGVFLLLSGVFSRVEEPVELAARGVEGFLLIFGDAWPDQWAFVCLDQ